MRLLRYLLPLLLIPQFAFAAYAVPIQATTTTGTIFAYPAKVNGTFPILMAPRFFASSTVASWLSNASTTAFSATTICLTGDICRTTWPTSSAGSGVATTSLTATWPITLSTSPLITYGFNGLSTTSPWTIGQLAYVADGNHVTSVGTSTLSASSPLTGSFVQVGSGGAIGIQAASASQAGSMGAGDFQRLYAATSTFTSPLIYTLGTNAVTLQAASASQIGSMSAGDWQLLHTATTTFTSPLIYTLGTNAVTCQAATDSVPGCLSAADHTTFNAKISSVSIATAGNLSGGGSGSSFTLTSPWPFSPTTYGGQVSGTSTPILDFPGFIGATSTFGTITASSSITNQSVKSALVLNSAVGLEGAYGGAGACSANNFVTTISALGATSCGSAAISGVSLGGSLFAHTVSGSITGTSYNGSAAVSDWTLNMANANSWTATQTFKSATSTNLSASGSFFAPAITTLAVPAIVTQIAVNTTAASSSLEVGSFGLYATTTVSFSWSTTSPSTVATDTITIINGPRGFKLDNMGCRLVAPATATTTIAVGTGTATSTYIVASGSAPVPTTLSTNNSFQAWQTIYVAIGNYSSLGVSQVSCGFGSEYTY